MDPTQLTGHCTRPCDCSILNYAPCPPNVVSYTSFCEFATQQNLSLCLIEKIAGSCSIPKPWVSCFATTTQEPTTVTQPPPSLTTTQEPTTVTQPPPSPPPYLVIILVVVILTTVIAGLVIFLCCGRKYKRTGKSKGHGIQWIRRFKSVGYHHHEIANVKLTYHSKIYAIDIQLEDTITGFDRAEATTHSIKTEVNIRKNEIDQAETAITEDELKSANGCYMNMQEESEDTCDVQKDVDLAEVEMKVGCNLSMAEIGHVNSAFTEDEQNREDTCIYDANSTITEDMQNGDSTCNDHVKSNVTDEVQTIDNNCNDFVYSTNTEDGQNSYSTCNKLKEV